MKTKNIFITLIAIMAFFVIAVIITLQTNKYMAKDNKEIQLPETIFDATATVPGTRLAFSYPSKGFYGHGIEVSVFEDRRFVQMNPTTDPSSEEKINEFVGVYVAVQDLPVGQSSLEEYINTSDPFFAEYLNVSEVFEVSNSISFRVIKLDERSVEWHARALIDNNIIEVMLAYPTSTGSESGIADMQNKQTFLQLLKTFRLQ